MDTNEHEWNSFRKGVERPLDTEEFVSIRVHSWFSYLWFDSKKKNRGTGSDIPLPVPLTCALQGSDHFRAIDFPSVGIRIVFRATRCSMRVQR
jgi:hypothetical protein